jgi:phosphoserine phosphatase
MNSGIGVVSLDLDGVLYDGPSAAYPLAKATGIGEKFLQEMARFNSEGLSFEETIAQGARIWEGIPAYDEKYVGIITELPLMVGAETVIETLHDWGFYVGCISSGVSQFFMKPFKKRLGLDFAYSNILGESDGKHSGKIEYVMGGQQKAERIMEVLNETGLTEESLASVGDGMNDIPIFKISKLSIAFNPSNEQVQNAATHYVHSKDLRDILPFLKPNL